MSSNLFLVEYIGTILLYKVIHFVVSKVNVNKAHIKYIFFMIFLFYCNVWTSNIMCGTLHHLNNLRANCCKHWFFAPPPSHLRNKARSKQWHILPQIRQFCLLTYPPSVTSVSSLKKILFEKLPSTDHHHFLCVVWQLSDLLSSMLYF